jgi:uncharacterized membrane protein YdbT with pleckstrin-like domain
MGAYISSNLIKDETVLHEARLHWSIYVFPVFLLLLSCVVPPLFIFSIPYFILVILNRRSSEIGVTNKRVLIKTGILARKVIEMPLKKVESQHVSQGIIERIFGAGTLNFRGSGSTPTKLGNISEPFALTEAIDAAQ